MSGGQDEASEYIKTGGVNVFKKTERTKCGNCVYFGKRDDKEAHGWCFRFPRQETDEWVKDTYWCGEFVDREPEAAKPWGEIIVEQAVENVVRGMKKRDAAETAEFHQSVKDSEEVKGQPAGELRECDAWALADKTGRLFKVFSKYHHAVDACNLAGGERVVHVREVPSRERVREALDEYAENKLCLNWDSHERMYPSNSEYVLQLLCSLGIDTECL